jgi:S1-C subfamily serine protease
VVVGCQNGYAAMLTSNIYHRVFQLWAERRSGTAFAIDVVGRQYLVTAKHVLAGAKEIALTFRGKPQPARINGTWESADADVAVIALAQLIAPALPIKVTSDGYYFSQDGYIVGFPLGIAWQPTGDPNRGFPVAIPKRALISGELGLQDGRRVLLLDAHANEGFSGGPVVINAPKPNDVQIIAIVIAYRAQELAVRDADRAKIGAVQANTGLALAERVDLAVDGARALGTGIEMPEPDHRAKK